MSQFDRARERYERKHGKPEAIVETLVETPKQSNEATMDILVNLMGIEFPMKVTLTGVAGNLHQSQLTPQGFSLVLKEALMTKFGKSIYVHDIPGG
jgi:hypothetical protein